MSRYKAVISYDGSGYGGWQKQPNTNSIQEEVETALLKIHGVATSVVASGRTDALVHAVGQVFHFDSEIYMEPEQWVRAFNALLPKDIRIQMVAPVSDDFHARFSALQKRYDYLITSDTRNPFYEHYMAKDYKVLDVKYMQECADVFIGTHDFTSFTSNKIDPRKPRVKTIMALDIDQETTCVRLTFVGSGFLRYMVRMIAQTLIECGKHRIHKHDVQRMLDGKSKHLCHYKAPAQGLYLMEVIYDETYE